MKILVHSYHRRSKADFRATPLARELARRGHKPTLLCIANHGRFGIRDFVEDGVRFVEVPDLFTGKLRSSWDPWDALNRAYFLWNERFDVVHAFETRPAVIHPTQINLWRNKAAFVTDWSDWWGRGGLIEHQRPWWYRIAFGRFETFYEEHFRSRAHATTVISRGLIDRAISLGVERDSIHWIPNGCVSDAVVTPPTTYRAKFSLPMDSFVMFDSAHDVLMGVELVFEALAHVTRRRDNVLFVMTGRHRDALQRLAARYGVAQHFRHLGFVPKQDLLHALSCANVFTIPYIDNVGNRGRWPGRVGNYLPLGRPIVSNPVGEMRHLIADHQLGMLARQDAEDFADKVTTLIDDPDLAGRLGANARKASEAFSWVKMTDRLEACYEGAIARFQAVI